MSIFLSIDFDFFVYENPMWDLDHEEVDYFETTAWSHRSVLSLLGHYKVDGFTLRELMDSERFEPQPLCLADKILASGFRFSEDCRLFVALSHVHAVDAFMRSNRSSQRENVVVNLDAHHDMGYKSLSVLQKNYDMEIRSSGSWLWFLMKRFPELRAHQVYPLWKAPEGKARFPWDMRPIFEKGMRERFTTQRWRKKRPYIYLPRESKEISTVFLCRSDAWVPPWCDSSFKLLVKDLRERLGCKPTIIGKSPMVERTACLLS